MLKLPFKSWMHIFSNQWLVVDIYQQWPLRLQLDETENWLISFSRFGGLWYLITSKNQFSMLLDRAASSSSSGYIHIVILENLRVFSDVWIWGWLLLALDIISALSIINEVRYTTVHWVQADLGLVRIVQCNTDWESSHSLPSYYHQM